MTIGDNPLELWSKYVSSEGRVRRIEDDILNGDRVIEIRGPDDSNFLTNISCPDSPIDCLNIKLPVLVVIMKNLKARFRMDFQLIDTEGIRRKFFVSTYELSNKGTMVENNTARIIVKLEEDWNNLEIDLRTWCQTIFRTEYKNLQRLIIYQNCRLRRVYLQDRHYEAHETPIELCQAFFDMYLLKWGIHNVDKNCQTSGTFISVTNDEALLVPTGSPMSEVRQSTKSLPVNQKQSNAKKNSAPKAKQCTAALKENVDNFMKNLSTARKVKISRAETARRSKTTSSVTNGEVGRKICSAKEKTEKKSKNEDSQEGQIFRKWPYKYLQLEKIDNRANRLKSFSQPNSIIGQTKFPSLERTLNRPFPKIHLPKISIEIPLPPEIEKVLEEANENLKGNISTTRSRLLATDEAVHNYLELRHVINRKMLESFQTRGLTMTEVELSIYNSKKRQNSYGQNKLLEKGRTSVEKACDVITDEQETIKKSK
ncbi:uncharacterized protein [Venturia canescens]|uniref:uncharacterized protein isoform X2 n=1 Tax=Venturia canescens TaxID=32260 RepID=UPI001C9BF75B|nr:uncharacterized protein LOC122415635 isoform X2 [Venturia canescens]